MSGRETIYIFPRLEGHGHRLRGRDRAGMAQHPNDVRTTVGALLADGWGVAAADHGYLLLRRARRQRRCHPPSTRRGRRICCRRPVTMCALRRRSLCWATRSRPETPQSGRLVTTLYLRGRASPTDLGVYIAYLDPGRRAHPRQPLLPAGCHAVVSYNVVDTRETVAIAYAAVDVGRGRVHPGRGALRLPPEVDGWPACRSGRPQANWSWTTGRWCGWAATGAHRPEHGRRCRRMRRPVTALDAGFE
ncbi:MAG: hypothetical protein R2838_12125 [Caldilineaceae bacterium]